MQLIYIFGIGIVGIIVAIAIGLELSKDIEEFVIYILFWMLYIITIITFINIFMVGNYYLTMKDKTGPPGMPGPVGDTGDKGKSGICDPKCRDNICVKQVTELIQNTINDYNNGKPVKIDNIYIKSKITQMCASDEFKKLAPYNGPTNLINYIKDIWAIWIKLIYDAGGIKYFENIAAETEFEWLSSNYNDGLELHNPFDEIKKYDVFYWGMGKQYRPQVVDKCYFSSNGDTPTDDYNVSNIIKVSPTTLYENIGTNSGISFWRAKQFTYKGIVYYPVGDVVIGPTMANHNNLKSHYIGDIKIQKQMRAGPMRESIIVSGDLKGPINYDLIWNNGVFWLWRPIASRGYIALGDVATFSSSPPLTGDEAPIRCVPNHYVIQVRPNGNRFWSSTNPTNVSILGFVPNDGNFVKVNGAQNCYNLFRTVLSLNADIPKSDVNGSFYYLDIDKYDTSLVIGKDDGFPSTDKKLNYVGKGYINTPQKDVKYSVLTYLNLKNNATLKHSMTNMILYADIIPNAITNAYLIKFGNDVNTTKCLNYNNINIKLDNCDELLESQIFSIIFTGNKSNECKLQHYLSKKIVSYKNNVFKIVNENDKTDIEYRFFIMS